MQEDQELDPEQLHYFSAELSKDEVLEKLAAGESLAGARLVDLDLEGAQLGGAQLSGVIFKNTL